MPTNRVPLKQFDYYPKGKERGRERRPLKEWQHQFVQPVDRNRPKGINLCIWLWDNNLFMSLPKMINCMLTTECMSQQLREVVNYLNRRCITRLGNTQALLLGTVNEERAKQSKKISELDESWRIPSSGMWSRVDLVWTDVSEERIASIFRNQVEQVAAERSGFSEPSIPFYQTTRRHITGDSNISK
jgi:hypothetical protein